MIILIILIAILELIIIIIMIFVISIINIVMFIIIYIIIIIIIIIIIMMPQTCSVPLRQVRQRAAMTRFVRRLTAGSRATLCCCARWYYIVLYYITLFWLVWWWLLLWAVVVVVVVVVVVISLSLSLSLCIYIYIYICICVYIYIYIYIYISCPRGDRKFGGCFLLVAWAASSAWVCCERATKPASGRADEWACAWARWIELARCRSVRYLRCPAVLISLPAPYRADLSVCRRQV